ncbi:MAG TPA: HAD family phosphatase [Defluviitaleaceae bacterium]|nr:HAD family phosphatase [Candidatus Epulonipiscium sp.]HOA79917.1 HAD family phosphatase [Defluviitaleaceae bacterium]
MEAFIFDMDGVIIDSQPIHFEVEWSALRSFGINEEKEYLEKYAGMTDYEMWELIKKEYTINEPTEKILEQQIKDKVKVVRELDIQPIEGIKELIKNLSDKHIPIAVASSSPRALIEEILNKFAIYDYFDVVISGEEVNKGKPAPDIYLKAAKLMKVNPKECVVLEDTKHGVIAAKEAGMKCIGYINPNSGKQDLKKADLIVKKITEIDINLL